MTTSSNESSSSDSERPAPGNVFPGQGSSSEPAGSVPAASSSAARSNSDLTTSPYQPPQTDFEESELEMVRRGNSASLPAQYAGAEAQRRLERIQAAHYVSYKRSQVRRSAILFLLTFLSTFVVGSGYYPIKYLMTKIDGGYEEYLYQTIGEKRVQDQFREAFQHGFQYSVPLMLILFCHEMGHYLQSVRYRVPASLPYFIPLPLPPMGTMGAVIFQGRGTATRKQMFDIAVSGPIAGLIITIPVLWYGIQTSKFVEQGPAGFEYGEPLLVQWLIQLQHGEGPVGHVFQLNGLGFAGWVGVLITAMNLLPVGQLDGGHILYTLIGKPAHFVAYGVIGVAVFYMLQTQNYSFTLLLFLLLLTGPKHPPTRNDKEPIGVVRHIIGWLTLSFLVIGFTPNPIIVPESGGPKPSAPAETPTADFAAI